MGLIDDFLDEPAEFSNPKPIVPPETPKQFNQYPSQKPRQSFVDQYLGDDPAPKQNAGAWGDFGTSLKRGVENIPGMITGLADIAPALTTGTRPFTNAAEWLGEKTGFQPGKLADDAQNEYSQGYRKDALEVGKAWDDPDASPTDKLGAYLSHPAYMGNQIAGSIPGIVAGGVAARSAMTYSRLAPVAEDAAAGIAARSAVPGMLERATGEWAAPIAGGIGEGAVQAGQQMDGYKGDEQGRNAVAALGSGLIDAVMAVGAGRLANKMGLETADTAMAKAFDNQVRSDLSRLSLGKRVAGGAISEGVLQELPQSAQEAVWDILCTIEFDRFL